MFEASPSTRLSASAPIDREGAPVIRRPRPKRQRTALSFEIIPPRPSDSVAKMDELIAGLAAYNPDYVSVTSSRRSEWLEGTAAVISRIAETTDLRPIAHLACTAGTREELTEWIRTLIDAGVRGFLALRGDLPETGMPEHYLQYATDLLNLIEEVQEEEAFRLAAGKLALSVACYPKGHEESRNFDHDLDVLLTKQRLGADFAITQLFFEAQDYLDFVEVARLAGVRIPLIPGIMPMTSLKRVRRMGELSGLEVPEVVEKQLLEADDEYETGMQLTANLAREILDAGTGGLHVYTHNNLAVTRDFLDRIGIQ
ncbi:methylenetetrahydrofolate reductase (NADPH) [Corynebacterium coyleae]|uniref:Methylenetetrahydrofolate reductase n=1 Tax=Corynebacterium coyleae TaxID=53374 RepID=A0AAP6XLJ6_9CORY|nr:MULTISPECIES: methylenetetrahydrofolate reductase [Corynebacterium]NJJ03510.1 methylenetetrahydrofolate reductase [Corynebacterium coyleae]OFT71283.1 5,10-methylenetetrahydrofolate reductase [Corynebacterium sp. HMSC05C01]OHO27617.1 5,10-methylenetetrahydrofolate reductase [Corynebacterium sp. HMSC034B08]OHO35209.1 5,10-methylenetetrahydrofolate reductase [Corynebacterium sp. HMSC034E11]QXB19391.1 methylenetetrahydrofolate reductase [Corynebacterium coyleae]